MFLSEVVVVGLDFGAVGERQTRPKFESATAKSAKAFSSWIELGVYPSTLSTNYDAPNKKARC